jgi:carboxymethylenebutenolidase
MRITLPSGTQAEIAWPDSGPEDDPPSTGLVIAPDIFGLRPLFDDLCARLAQDWGVVACAPEPFAGLDLPPDVDVRRPVVKDLIDAERLRDLGEAADATGCGRTVMIGFCMGGMYVHKAAADERFERLVSFYGMIRVPAEWQAAGQGEPLDALASTDASRVLAIIGELDPYTPPGDVDALEAVGAVVARYPDAEHGFVHDPNRPAHRADDAADAWQRTRDWLEV